MDDDLVDAIVRSLGKITGAQAASPYAVRHVKPVVVELVNRMRNFGYDDEHIHAILTGTIPTVPNGPEAAYTDKA